MYILHMACHTALQGSPGLRSPEISRRNPGHAIEAGWFLLRYAQRTGNGALAEAAEKMVIWSFEAGAHSSKGSRMIHQNKTYCGAVDKELFFNYGFG